MLLVLNRLLEPRIWPRTDLTAIGARLGADVPVFVNGRNALGEGIGERLTPLDLPAAWYLVLAPQVSVSTREIFGLALTGQSKALKIPPFFSGLGANDLEAAVVARYPEVAAHLDWLRKRRPQARMTGSGACVFAEFDSQAEALALHHQLPGGMQGIRRAGTRPAPALRLERLTRQLGSRQAG